MVYHQVFDFLYEHLNILNSKFLDFLHIFTSSKKSFSSTPNLFSFFPVEI